MNSIDPSQVGGSGSIDPLKGSEVDSGSDADLTTISNDTTVTVAAAEASGGEDAAISDLSNTIAGRGTTSRAAMAIHMASKQVPASLGEGALIEAFKNK